MRLFRRPQPVREPANKGKRYPADHVRPDEVRAMMQVLATGKPTDTRLRGLIGVLWGSGLRIAEALALESQDVDAERRQIRVRDGKGHKARTTTITPSGMQALQDWLDIRARWCLRKDGPVFCTREGRPLASANIRSVLPKVAARAGVDRRIHAHAFRHTYAVELARAGVPMPLIQRLLGHSNLGTTNTYLQSLSPEEALDAARGLDW